MTTSTIDIEAAKAAARDEIEAYRERKRRDREAQEAAAETAEAEIERAIIRRREEEAASAEIRAELAKLYAEREAKIAAQEQADTERKKLPTVTAAPAARRVALRVRKKVPDDAEFAGVVADIRAVNFDSFKNEMARVLQDERDAVIHRQRQENAARLAAEATTLPAPESDEEAAILKRHGFIQ